MTRALRHAIRNGADDPNTVVPVSAATFHSVLRPGRRRIAVEQHDRRAGEQSRHEVVPHHPAGGREPEEAVGRGQVLVERQHLEVLGDDAAVTVDDRLGQSRRARAEQHVQRVVGGDRP